MIYCIGGHHAVRAGRLPEMPAREPSQTNFFSSCWTSGTPIPVTMS
jgi:hypothetical protein